MTTTTEVRGAIGNARGDAFESLRMRSSIAARMFQQGRPAKLGRYVVGELLGQGGMGAVYAAFDPQLQRRVAIKVLSGEPTEGASARLHREAEALAALSHPNVVTIYEVGWCAFGLFVVMELVDGVPLSLWLEQHPDPLQRFDAALELLLQAGRGLAAAHAAGLVHRDVKPSNVLVGRDHDGSPRARVADFGLVRQHSGVDSLPDSGDVTPMQPTRDRVGTPAYMSPEQIDGELLDARSDQFSFCVTAFEVLFGYAAFGGDNLYKRRVSIERGPDRPRVRAAKQRRVFEALRPGLSESPTLRHRDMAALLDALERARAGRGAQVLGFGVAALGVTAVVAGLAGPVDAAPVVVAIDPCDDAQPMMQWWERSGAPALSDAVADVEDGDAMEGSISASVLRQAVRHDDSWRRACASDDAEERAIRLACLTERRDDARQVFASVIAEPRSLVEHGAGAIESLADPGRCNDVERARDSDVFDPFRRTISALTRAADDAERAGHTDLALAIAVAAHAKAMAADRPTLSGRVAFRLGLISSAAGHRHMVSRWWTIAYEDAVRAGDDFTAARAACGLLGAAQSTIERTRWRGNAEAALMRVGNDTELQGEYWTAVGHSVEQSDPVESERAHRRALDIKATDEGSNRSSPIADLVGMGAALNRQARRDEALGWAFEAQQLATAVLGPRHPNTLHIRFWAASLLADRDPVAAAAVMDQLEAETRTTFGEHNYRYALMLAQRGTLESRRGNLDAGEAALVRAQALFEALPTERAAMSVVRYQLGYIAMRRGELDRAQSEFEAARELFDDPLLDATFAVRTLIALARLHQRRGEWPRAIERLEEALAWLETHPDPAEQGEVLAAIASSLFDSGRRTAARPYVEQALPLVASTYGADSQRMAELLHVRGDIEADEGDLDAALATYAKAERIMIARENRMWRVIGFGRFRQAELSLQAGERRTAIAFASAAIEAYEQDGHSATQVAELRGWHDDVVHRRK